MGVEFRLGRQDGHKAEDFLARGPKGVAAITLNTRQMRHQVAAAEAAMAMDIDVLFDPLTERLVAPGFEMDGFPYWHGQILNLDHLKRDAGARTTLIDEVLAAHPDTATLATPAHFYVDSDHGLELNLALAEETGHKSQRDLRPILLVSRAYAHRQADALAHAYATAGFTSIELRLTPVGGEDEGLRKISSVFAICAAFTKAGLEVTLGASTLRRPGAGRGPSHDRRR